MERNATGRGYINHFKEMAIHFILGGAALVLILNPFTKEWEDIFYQWIFNGALWVALGFGNGRVVDWLETKLPWLEMPVKRLVASLLLSMLYTVVAAVVIFVIFVSLRYGVSMASSFAALDKGYLMVVILITIIISLFLHGRGFFLSWKASFMESEKLKRAHLSAQYESLKNQVNPHFLFNSFNVLSSLVYKDQDMAAKFIQQLSSVYRYILDTRQMEVVPLSQELEMLDAFVFLLKMRFGEALRYTSSLQPEEEVAVVPLALQMLVENAVKHNVVSKRRPLQLEIYQEAERIIVRNNRQPREDEMESLGIGLPNIQERYRYLAGLELEINQDDRFFTVSLPLIKLENRGGALDKRSN